MALMARVLIVAGDDRFAGPLADGLDRLGWPTVTARSLEAGAARRRRPARRVGDRRPREPGRRRPTPPSRPCAPPAGRGACPSWAWAFRRRPPPTRSSTSCSAPRPIPRRWRSGSSSSCAPPSPRRSSSCARPPSPSATRSWSCPSDADAPLGVLIVGSPSPQVLALTNALAPSASTVSAPSPPTPRSTICTSARSTRWCSGPARTRPRRCPSPRACGATPASTTSPPCSICRPRRR